jgi:exopolysaccharide biosynthesis polyprenyl glycosylphosphotransferase
MLRQFSPQRVLGFLGFDLLGSLLSLFLAGLVWQGSGNEGALPSARVFIIVALIWPFILRVFNLYDGRHNTSWTAEALNTSLAVTVGTLVLAGVIFLWVPETPRGLIGIFYGLDLFVLLGGRSGWYLYRAATRTSGTRRNQAVLIIGAGEVGLQVAENLARFSGSNITLAGFLDDDPSKPSAWHGSAPILGSLDQAAAIVQQQAIQHAVVALPLRAHERLLTICRRLQELDVRVHIVPDLFALYFTGASLDGFGGIPLVDLGQPGLNPTQLQLKRYFDVFVVATLLALGLPVLTLIALLIRLDSPGPVLYRQPRVGRNGRMFLMFKFRSMKTGAETQRHEDYVRRLIRDNVRPKEGTSLKLQDDPRITRVGRLMRRLSLDELPQLFNVLRGEMSLVGPRPPLPYEVEEYQTWHKKRLEVPPGITGLWQVTARNQVSFDEMVRLDLEYIRRQSLWMDIQLLLRTPWSLLVTNGSG